MKNPFFRRIAIAIFTGAVLGVLCIIGVGTRLGYYGNEAYLLGMWYNRVIMGLIIGLSEGIILIKKRGKPNSILRGAIIGLIVTTAILLSTSFRDIPSFFFFFLYGVIIDWVATSYS